MKRALNFFEVDLSEPSETIECINLLKAMELEEDIEEEKEEEMLDLAWKSTWRMMRC